MKIIFEETIEQDNIDVEDSGCAKLVQITDTNSDEECLFIRLQSWDDFKEHKTFNSLMGKKIRITVEVIE